MSQSSDKTLPARDNFDTVGIGDDALKFELQVWIQRGNAHEKNTSNSYGSRLYPGHCIHVSIR